MGVGRVGWLFLPLLNTVLTATLRSTISHFILTTVEVAFDTVSCWSSQGRLVSSALLFSLAGKATATFHQKRLGLPEFSAPVSSIPFLFDATSEFRFTFAAPGGAVILAAQNLERFELDVKSWGKLESRGFGVEDPKAWVVPKRRPFDLQGVLNRSLCYVGKGSRQHRPPASNWSALLRPRRD